MLEDGEWLLYRWDHGVGRRRWSYFVIRVEDWARYDKTDRDELARGTREEMDGLRKLTKEEA